MPDTAAFADFELIRDERRRLILRRPTLDDVVGVRIRQAFPWSDPGKFLSIRSPEGKELLLIQDATTLPPSIQLIIAESLADASFMPTITQVYEIDTRFEGQQWRVLTDRGPVDFRVQEREDIRFLNDGRFNVKDVNGNLYVLPKLETLDEPSRKIVEKLI